MKPKGEVGTVKGEYNFKKDIGDTIRDLNWALLNGWEARKFAVNRINTFLKDGKIHEASNLCMDIIDDLHSIEVSGLLNFSPYEGLWRRLCTVYDQMSNNAETRLIQPNLSRIAGLIDGSIDRFEDHKR